MHKQFNGEKNYLSSNDAGAIGNLEANIENELQPESHTINKN